MIWIWIWAAVFVVCLIAEGVSAALVSIWFALGALFAGVSALLFPDLVWLQFVLFLVVSTAALILTRPLARKLATKKTPTNADRNVGSEAMVLTPISHLSPGTVKVNGLVWTAVSSDDTAIAEGSTVLVCGISGSKLIVSPKQTA